MKSSDFLLKKAHHCVNPRRLSHFAWRLVEWSDPQSLERKSQKVTDSHRNDASPLTQGLNYRSACYTCWVTLHPLRLLWRYI